MWGYQRGFSWEDVGAEGLVGMVILAAIIAAAVSITITIVLLRELVSIFQRRAFQPTTSARVLWLSLAILVTLWSLVALLAGNPAQAPMAILASWSTLLAVIIWEFIDVHEGRSEQERHGHVEELDSYLGEFTPAPVSTNGKTPTAIGSR